MSHPLVSIVIPSYKPEFFEQTLRSALGQTYPNIQVLVLDNCPDEGIKNICAQYPKVLYQRSYLTRGDNVRTALFSGAGKYIKPLFDDDILHPFCVEYFVYALESRDDLSFVYSSSAIINQNNFKTKIRKRHDEHTIISEKAFLNLVLSGPTNPVGEFSSVMFSREVLWKVGLDFDKLFGVSFKCLTDVAFFVNLSRHGKVIYLSDELTYFRRDPSYESNSNPSYNPNFAYCFADYLDILMACDKAGLVSNFDYSALGKGYFNLVFYVSQAYPQVLERFSVFKEYILDKYGINVDFAPIEDE